MTKPTKELRACFCVGIKAGTYANQVTLSVPDTVTLRANNPERQIKRIVSIDTCIAHEVQSLWRDGIATTGCCCGHNYLIPYIGVEEQHIPEMLLRGYQVQLNSTDPTRNDSFVPKSLRTIEHYTTPTNTSPQLTELTPQENFLADFMSDYYDLLHKYGYADFKLQEKETKGFSEEEAELFELYIKEFGNLYSKQSIAKKDDAELRQRIYHLVDACSLNDGHRCEKEGLMIKHNHSDLLANREALERIMAAIDAYVAEQVAAAETRGELKIWKELKRGEGLCTNESGCRELHVDYIDERIEFAQKKVMNNG